MACPLLTFCREEWFTICFMDYDDFHLTREGARALDREDALRSFRREFCFPSSCKAYFAGHSLGLRPRQTEEFVGEELEAWAKMGVKGHFAPKSHWFSYHESAASPLARLVGAKEREVVAMNSLTVNLHLMLVSFYRPTKKRYKILIENNSFPSDKYAVDSQARFHGFDPKEAIVELKADRGITVSWESIMETMDEHGDSLALVMLGNCNYLSGQCFDMEKMANKAKSCGAFVGFNLAHGAGNLKSDLHKWGIDFAVWCSYKYLNSGPGGIAGAFVHENHHADPHIPRFEGWWGSDKKTRFAMNPNFSPSVGAEAWQLSNPPIFQLAALRSSLDLFDRAGMEKIAMKRDRLTLYLEALLQKLCPGRYEIMTPPWKEGTEERGGMLCLRFREGAQRIEKKLSDEGIVVDFRPPDIIRIAMAPLYNNHEDVFQLVETLSEST